MWKVTWNYRGRWDLGGEKTFAKNYAAQSFANFMIRKGGITQTKVEAV
jgi:hypothetical protein